MTLSALLLRERYFSRQAPRAFKYGTLGVLFVNVSIGGTLTPFAAPPVLMVAERWGWDFSFMLQTFGWKAALAVLVNAAAATFAFRSYLAQLPTISAALARLDVPWPIVGAHLCCSWSRSWLPPLQAAEHDQAAQKQPDHKSFAQDQPALITTIGASSRGIGARARRPRLQVPRHHS